MRLLVILGFVAIASSYRLERSGASVVLSNEQIALCGSSDTQGYLPGEDAEGGNCCSFIVCNAANLNKTGFLGKCMRGTVWNKNQLTCTDPEQVTGCDPTTCTDVNLMFVFDTSGSISVGSFEWSKEVAINIYESLVANGDNALASALTFDVTPKIKFTADEYTPTSDPGVVDAINAITLKPPKSGRRQSNTDKLFELIKEELEKCMTNRTVFVVLFYDGVLFPRTRTKRIDVIKMANSIEQQNHADILGVKLKNLNNFNGIGATDLKKIASGDPEQNDVFPKAGGNLNADNKDEVAEAIVKKISGK